MKYINLFETQAAYDAAEKYYPNTSYIEASDEVVYQENDPRYSSYLTFEALQSGTFGLTMNYPSDSIMTSISYSVDNGATWVDTVIGETSVIITTPTVNAGDKVLWKGIGTKLGNPNNFARSARFKSTGNCNVSGNIMSLLYGDNFAKQTTIPNYGAFGYVFSTYYGNGCKIVSAANLILPATTLADRCYGGMFNGCTSLTVAPVLPATTLASNCYQQMFQGCTGLTTLPTLPATTLADYCYSGMFSGCNSLTTVPSDLLPATTLASSCYYEMFQGCTALTTAPVLPATTLTSACYQGMFSRCTSLTIAPELPATTLENFCYKQMFQGCTSLTTAPELPATTLTEQCYSNMFDGCTNLTTPPELPATTLASGCYNCMFQNCTSLTTAPALPATTLVFACYGNMFYRCININNITMLATDISAAGCLQEWVYLVQTTSGTFTKAASMTTLPTGDNGIPANWTVVDAS